MGAPLPHLQFAVLGVLSDDSLSGRDLRGRLADVGVGKSGPAFYRLMSRLEEAGLVRGWYEQDVVNGQIVRERFYRVTSDGRRAREETARFHRRIMDAYSDPAEAHA